MTLPAEIRPTGRPRKYDTPDEFDAAVEAYVEQCRADEAPMTWTGLALALGFASRSAIDEYLDYDGFSYSVRRAKLLVEQAYEERLHTATPTGAIFALKNFGWKDKQEIEHSGEVGGVLRVGPAAPLPADWSQGARAQQAALPSGNGKPSGNGHGGP